MFLGGCKISTDLDSTLLFSIPGVYIYVMMLQKMWTLWFGNQYRVLEQKLIYISLAGVT